MSVDLDAQALLEKYPEHIRSLADRARVRLRRMIPNAVETVDAGAGVIRFGISPGYKGLVCTLTVTSAQVSIEITGGALLKDPHGIMSGSGKMHRCVALRDGQELDGAPLRDLVGQAVSRVQLTLVGQRATDG
jgi:hypothetical protein